LNLFFNNEIIFATITRPLHHPFYGRSRASDSTGEFEGNGGDVRRPASRGRPLYPAKAQRGGLEEIPADVSGDARFQPSLFHTGRRYAVTAKYGNAMAGDVLLGTLKPAYEIYALYTKRLDDGVAKKKELLTQPTDLKGNATVELTRQKSPWPKDAAEADQLWRGRITNELLQEHLSEHPIEPAPQL